MDENQGKGRKRIKKKKRSKGLKFWVLFVAAPIIVVLCVSVAFYGLHLKKKSSARRMQGYQQGLIFAKLNRHTEAIAEFKKELERNPDNTNVHYQMGNSFLALKEYDNAETAIKNALKLKPNFSEARFQLAIIAMTRADNLRKLGESESVVLEKFLEAEDLCRETIEKDQNFLSAYALLGQIHFSQGLLDDAIIDYKHLLNVDNTYVNGHVSLARLYLNKGELDLAEKECDMVLSEFEPDNLQALSMLSTIYEQKKKYDDAIVLLERILEKKPDNTSARIQLGLLYLRLSKYDEALAEAEYVSKGSPKSQPAAAYFIKGSVWLQRRDYEKAVTVLKEATLRLPDMAESHYFLAHAYVGLGRTQEAINEFKATINVAPTFLPAKLGLARLLSRIGGWQREIVRQCQEILEIKPDHTEALQLLGMAYINEQDLEKAEIQFKKINEINPSFGEINMAYLSLVTGQLSKCIRQCEEIIKTNPNEIRVYNILGLAHIRRGAFDSGIEQYKKVLEINPKSTSTLINIAKAYVVTEKIDEAKDALKNVITVDPNNLPSRNLLAGIYKKEGNINEAAKLLEQAIEINPDYLGGYALAGIYLLQGKVDESIDLCSKAIKLAPDNTTLYTDLVISYQQKKNYDVAMQYGKKLIELNPENPSSKIILINTYAASGEFSLANDQIESISSFTSDQKKAYHELMSLCQLNSDKGKQVALALNRSIFARQLGVLGMAINECKKAVELFPDNIVAKVILANNYLSVNKHEEAIAIYSEVVKDKPEFAASYYDLGRAYLMADKKGEAISTYENLIGVDSKSVEGRLALAAVLLKQGETDKAAQMIEGAIELDSENLMAHDLLGKVSLAEKDYEKAETEFSKMIELSRDSFEGHFNMARINFTQGDFDTSIKHCKSALEIRPVDVRVHNILGMAYMKKGQLEDAVFEFNKIIDINSDYIPAYLNLAKINIAGKRPGVAALLYKAALKVAPDALEARLGLGGSYAIMGNYSESIAEFESVIKKYPKNINAHIALARTCLESDKIDKAQEAVTSALSLEPDNPMARYVLAKIYVKKNEIQQAILQLKQVLPDNPKILDLYELGIFYIDIEEYDKAILTYKQGVENFPKNYLLWCHLAVAYQMNKDFEGAKNACDKAIEINHDLIIPNLCMAYIYLANGEYENARRHIEGKTNIHDIQKRMYFDLLELCNQNKEVADKVSYHLARTLAYTNYRWADRVLQECDELIKIVPTNVVAYNVQVDTLISTGEEDKAIEVCKKIVELEPENPAFYNKLAGIYHRKGEEDEALEQYRNATSVAPDDVTANLGMAMLLESKDLLEESVIAYKKVIELDPASKVANNNLAWLYALKMNEKDKALKLAERAKELDPNNPAINDTLGWIYYLDAKYDKAVPLLRAAVRNATWNPSVRYHLGMAYYQKGLQREAITEMQRALKISSTFAEAEEAKKIIEEIIVSRVQDVR